MEFFLARCPVNRLATLLHKVPGTSGHARTVGPISLDSQSTRAHMNITCSCTRQSR